MEEDRAAEGEIDRACGRLLRQVVDVADHPLGVGPQYVRRQLESPPKAQVKVPRLVLETCAMQGRPLIRVDRLRIDGYHRGSAPLELEGPKPVERAHIKGAAPLEQAREDRRSCLSEVHVPRSKHPGSQLDRVIPVRVEARSPLRSCPAS